MSQRYIDMLYAIFIAVVQLQTHIEVLEKFLKFIEECAQSTESFPSPREKALPLYEVLNKIFYDEAEKWKNILNDACRSITSGLEFSKYYFMKSIQSIIKSAYKTGTTWGNIENETAIRDLTQPLIQTISTLIGSLIQAAGLFSRKSFEAAFLVASKLEEAKSDGSIVIEVDEGDAARIHPTWSALTDKGCRLIPKITDFDSKVENIVNVIGKTGEMLLENVNDVHDYIYKRDRTRLSQFVYGALKEAGGFEDKACEGITAHYIVEHLMTLGERLEETENFTIENIANYLEVTFKQKGFLEYEVYAALLDHGIPSFPRLRIRSRFERGSGGERREGTEVLETAAEDNYYELDVAAVIGGELWLAEVTVSENEEELKSKVKRSLELMNLLGAREALVVCTRKAREIPAEVPALRSANFVTFESLTSELQRLIESSSRRRRPVAKRFAARLDAATSSPATIQPV